MVTDILFPTDFSETSNIAAVNAVAFANRCGARLTLLHASLIDEDRSTSATDPAFRVLDELEPRVEEAITAQLAHCPGQTVDVQRAQARGLTAGRTVLEYARAHPPDLIIMGTHGRRGFKRWLLGSVAEEIVRFSPCPVMTLKDSWQRSLAEINRILVPLDFSLASRPALRQARAMATISGATLELLHVIQPPPYPEVYAWSTSADFYRDAETKSRALLARLSEECIGTVPETIHIVTGYPAHEILQVARTRAVDLILIAHLGMTRLAGRPLGSVTEHVVRAASCPVLTAELQEI
jgi:nucleotide-binding universal stress UspA family protein